MTRQNHNNDHAKSIKELIFPVIGSDGLKRDVPALDKHWAPRSIFSTYSSLLAANGQFRTEASLEEWIYQAEIFRDDMEFLLRRSHHEFWSYIVYQKAVISSIASFLKNSIPFYINVFSDTISNHLIALYEEIRNLVLRILLRMVIIRESSVSWIEKEHLQDILYEKSLFSVPMLFDLLITVGNAEIENRNILIRIFNSLFEIEPRYKADIITSLTFLNTAFQSIQTQAENEGCEGAGGGNLSVGILETAFDDVVLYTIDCSFTLSTLLDVCPWIRIHCAENDFVQLIAKFYNVTLRILYRNIFYANDSALSLIWLNQTRIHLIYSCHRILSIFNENDLNEEKCNRILAECSAEELFIIDLERQYLDIKLPKTLDYITTNSVINKCESQEIPSADDAYALYNAGRNADGSRKKGTFHRDIDLEICMVLDCLPHLESDFVRRLLLYYDNSESAIAAILENNLPPDLEKSTVLQTHLPNSRTGDLSKEVGAKELNISHDNDSKCDMVLGDNEQCIIKKGKGFVHNIREIMDNKADINSFRHYYKQYYYVSEESDDNHEYEDEYDDSYDSVLYSETRKIKLKEVDNIIAEVGDQTDNENENISEHSSDENASVSKHNLPNLPDGRSLNFHENPELTRARYNAHKKHNYDYQKSHQLSSDPKNKNSDISYERKKKEIHKSTKSNHNRKMAAAYKRSKGMF